MIPTTDAPEPDLQVEADKLHELREAFFRGEIDEAELIAAESKFRKLRKEALAKVLEVVS